MFKILLIVFCSLWSAQIYAQDWANLDKYKDSNMELIKKKDTRRVVFMGNSITEGWGNYPMFDNPSFINRGISGQTTPQMLVRFRRDVVDLNPTAVVVLAGINDIAGNTGPSTLAMIFDNIKSMCEIASSNGISVILCSVLPANDFPWRPNMFPAPKVIALNRMIKKYADNKNYLYVDYYTPMVDEKDGLKPDLGSDGVHPNDKGYAIMEPLAKQAINKVLQVR